VIIQIKDINPTLETKIIILDIIVEINHMIDMIMIIIIQMIEIIQEIIITIQIITINIINNKKIKTTMSYIILKEIIIIKKI